MYKNLKKKGEINPIHTHIIKPNSYTHNLFIHDIHDNITDDHIKFIRYTLEKEKEK